MPPSRRSSEAPSKPPACAECTRLKKKCNRVWPCDYCVKRGCGALCPDQTSTPVRVGKTMVQEMEALRAENRRLRDTVGVGGDADDVVGDVVAISQAGSSAFTPPAPNQPLQHPRSILDLLQPLPPLLSPQSIPHASPISPLPNPLTSAAESLLVLHRVTTDDQSEAVQGGGSTYLGRGAGAMHILTGSGEGLFGGIPFVLGGEDWRALMPPRREAEGLMDSYCNSVDWMYRPIERDAARTLLSQAYDSPAPLHPHQSAVLLMLLALGQTFLHPSPSPALFFSAASALLFSPSHNALTHPTPAACQAMHLMVSYLFVTGDEENARAAWPLLGLQMRVCQSLGLHRGGEGTGREARVLWWESYTYDLLQSLNFGRPYSMPPHFVTCPQPTPSLGTDPSSLNSAFHTVKYAMAQVFGRIADCLSLPTLPPAETVAALDRELRDLENNAPGWLKFGEWVAREGETGTVPQRHMVALLKDKGLLALHRPFFALALKTQPEPLSSPYASSFMACISAARRHTTVMQSILDNNPTAAYHWWFFLFHAFTGAVIQASVLLLAPQSIMLDDIRSSFSASIRIFTRMKGRSRFAMRAVPILLGLRSKMGGKERVGMGDEEGLGVGVGLGNDYQAMSNQSTTSDHDHTSQVEQVMPTLDWFLNRFQPMPQNAVMTDPLIQTLDYWIPDTTGWDGNGELEGAFYPVL